MKVTRLDPAMGLNAMLTEHNDRLRSLETTPAGNKYIRETITTTDDNGVDTIFGRLPDGSYGIREFVNDVTPPNRPSTPAVTPITTGLLVEWDGKDSVGMPQPTDYLVTDIEYSKDGGVTWRVGAQISITNKANTILGLVGGVSHRVRLRSYDVNSNASDYSTIVTATPLEPVGADVDLDGLRNEFISADAALTEALSDNRRELEAAKVNITEVANAISPLQTGLNALKDSTIPAIQDSINGINKTYRATNDPPASVASPYKDGDTWEKWTTLSNGGVLLKSWRARQTVWVEYNIDPTYLPKVDISSGTFGQLTGGRIGAKSITTDQLLVGIGGNIYVDPDFKDSSYYIGNYIESTGGMNGKGSLLLPSSNTQSGSYYAAGVDAENAARRTPITGGSSYRISAWVRSSAAAPKESIALYARFYNAAGAWVFGTPSAVTNPEIIPANTWVQVEGIVTAPSTHTTLSLGFYSQAASTGSVRFSDPAIQQATSGSLIVYGTIKGDHLDAESVGAKVGTFIEADISKLKVTGTANITDLVAERMSAKIGSYVKLYASQIYVGQGGNQLVDPTFTDNDYNTVRRSRSTGTWNLVAGTASEPAAMRTTTATTNNVFIYPRLAPSATEKSEMIPVTTGQTYEFSVDVTTSATATCRWNMWVWRADGSFSYTGTTSFSVSGRKPLIYEYVVPAGVIGIQVGVACLTSGITWTVHGNGTVREKITPSLIVDGLMNGKRIVGASIETNNGADEGVKLADAGLISHGNATEYDPVSGSNIAYKVRARITTQRPTWSSFPNDTVPGMWFEGNRTNNAGSPPAIPAGIVASNGFAQGISMQSSQQINGLDYRSMITADQTMVSLVSQSNKTSTSAQPNWQSNFYIASNGWGLSTSQKGVSYSRASFRYEGEVDPNRIIFTVNGKDVYLEDTGWTQASLLTSFTHRTQYGWSGARWRAINGIFTLMGSVSRTASWNTGEAIATIPAQYLPPHRVMGTNAYADRATQTIQAENAGSGSLNFTVSWPYL